MYVINIHDLRQLDAHGSRTTGIIVQVIPAQQRRAPKYVYEFSVEGRAFIGSSVYWDALPPAQPNNESAIGLTVPVYYLFSSPEIHCSGNPGDQLFWWYFMEFVYFSYALGCFIALRRLERKEKEGWKWIG